VFRRGRRQLPPEPSRLFTDHLTDWPLLAASEQERLVEMVTELLWSRRWEGARGFDLTDEMCTVIAAQVALVCLGFEEEGLAAVHELKTIIVHPRTITLRGPHHDGGGLVSDGPRRLSGEAHDGTGPLLLAWDSVRRETRSRVGRRNVVIHEVAHKLDMLDGVIDGTPPLEQDGQMTSWVEVSTAEYEAVRNRSDHLPRPLIDDYAGTNTAEFFAVVSEVFFTRPVDMAAAHPDLYHCYRDFYRQDPAASRRSQP